MRVNAAPLNDVRVRQALRLCVDRHEMLASVFGGYGRIGNDLFSPFDPDYDSSIPQRVQDIDQAKYLLKKAGQEGLSLTMQSAPLAQGTTEMAQVMVEQAAQAGVKISLDNVTVTDFYGPEYKKWTFALDYWGYANYLPTVANATLPGAAFNETNWAEPGPPKYGPEYVRLYNQATSTANAATRAEIVHEMQMIEYTQGGYIIPYFAPVIDGYSKNVGGIVECLTGIPLSNYGFQKMYKIT
jgi:peptide/nickel transport system substrate-binding protein